MSLGRYALAVTLVALAFAPIAFGARQLRHAAGPQLRGAMAGLIDVVLVLTTTVVVSELLGTFGFFRVGPFAATMLLVGVCMAVAANRRAPRPLVEAHVVAFPASRLGRVGDVAALVAVALVFGTWCTRVFDALGHGMLSADTLWYHLPYAARFMQTGYTSHLYFIPDGSLTVFFPASSEILHASGMLLLKNDFLSLFLNLAFLTVALVAGWCIGRPYGVAPLTLIGTAIVLATPEIVLDDPGGGYNDVVAIAMLLAAVALLIQASNEREHRQRMLLVGVAGLAAGLAVGTKLTVLVPVVLLTLCVIFASRRGIMGRAALWLAAVFVGGGYFYVRNVVYAQNPLPALRAGVGPLHLPSTPPVVGQGNVAKYLANGAAWRDYLVPGLRDAMGLAWWAVICLALLGMIIAFAIGPDPRVRALGFTGAVTFVAYLYSPQVISVGPRPYWFVTNVRYMAPALVLGLACLPLVAARSAIACRVVLFMYLVVFGVTVSDRLIWRSNVPTIINETTRGELAKVLGLVVAFVVLTIVVLGIITKRIWSRRGKSAVLAGVIAVTVIGGFPAANYFMNHRYRDPDLWALAAFRVHNARIGTVNLLESYPLYGDDLSNFVQAVGQRGSRGSFVVADTRARWLQDLAEGRYSYVVIATPNFAFPTTKVPPQLKWTTDDVGAQLVRSDNVNGAHIWVFALRQPLEPSKAASSRTAP